MDYINEMNNLVQTISSREVAKMMEKEHWEVLRMIEGNKDVVGIIPVLIDHSFVVNEYFIESEYKASNGKSNKCYECTKMGCEMLANKLTGEKGILFTARYVNKFNKMEQYIKEQNTPYAKPQTRWTQAGKKFIHDILRKNGYKTILENQQEQQRFDFN